MTWGILITARLASTRLPGKHLRPAAGKSMLHWLIERCRRTFASELSDSRVHLVLATTTEPLNDPFEELRIPGLKIFRGSVHNIPLRHLQAAAAIDLEGLINVDGDDILCAPEGLRAIYEGLAKGATGVRTEGLPFGLNSWGYRTDYLREILKGRAEERLETGWARLFDFSRFQTVTFNVPGNSDRLRYTLDYEDDFQLFKAVFETLGEDALALSPAELVRLTWERGWEKIVSARVDEYWENFHKDQARDIYCQRTGSVS